MLLTPDLLISAYAQGVFPMAQEDGEIYWYDPDPRAILPLDNLHIPRRLRQKLKRQPFDIYIDRDFTGTMRACALPTAGRETTWIDTQIIAAYTRLHRLGFAHSVEAWQDDKLVGGLYGVSLRGLFAGESMFSKATDASKICLVYLVEHLRNSGFQLLDVQFQTDHLARFGVIEIPQADYKNRLNLALDCDVNF